MSDYRTDTADQIIACCEAIGKEIVAGDSNYYPGAFGAARQSIRGLVAERDRLEWRLYALQLELESLRYSND